MLPILCFGLPQKLAGTQLTASFIVLLRMTRTAYPGGGGLIGSFIKLFSFFAGSWSLYGCRRNWRVPR